MISDIPNDPGVYGFYNDNDRALYVGSTKNLRKRIQSYEEQDHTHPTKVQLRNHISKVGYKEMPLNKARELEGELKCDTVYNYD
jgi:excinuclease UvrABC nuclease subunit